MDNKIIKRSIGISIIAIIWLGFLANSARLYYRYKTIDYTVIGIKNEDTSVSTGKHSSEIRNRYYIRLLRTDADGSNQVTTTVDDPFVAETYTVGMKYTEDQGYVEALFYEFSLIGFLTILTVLATTTVLAMSFVGGIVFGVTWLFE